MTMGNVKQKIVSVGARLADAIRELQNSLGETQEGMARRLGCTLGAYSKWVRGERVPGDEWLLEMLALCPDDEARAAFGLKFEVTNPRRPGGPGRKLTEAQEERLRNYNDAVTGINILYEVAEAGHADADEVLRDLADRINKRAGDWRRVKYSKLGSPILPPQRGKLATED